MNDTRDRRRLILLALIVGVAYIFYNAMPMILKSAGDTLALSEARLGYLASSYLLGSVLSNTLATLWVRRLNWRYAVGGSTLIAALGYALGGFVDYSVLLLLMFIVGAANAAIVSCIITFIGDRDDATQGFAYMVGVQNVFAGAWSFLLPLLVIPFWSYTGVALTLALGAVLMLPLLRYLPTTPPQAPLAAATKNSARASARLLWSFIALFCYYLGQSGIWAFFGRIGGDGGLSDLELGFVFGFTLLTGAVGGFMAAWCMPLSDRRILLTVGIVAGIVPLVILLLPFGTQLWPFTLAVFLFCVSWNFLSPYFMTIISEHDIHGRYAALIPAVQLLGSVIGPALAGNIVRNGDYHPVYWFAIMSVLLSLVIFIAVDERKIKTEPVFEPAT